MIAEALDFIREKLDAYLHVKHGITDEAELIVLDNISWHDSADTSDKDKSNAFISLVNIEEDRISKSPENFARLANGSIVYKKPKLFLNLYVLFAVNLSTYSESLKRLSYIIQFFQHQNVFTPASSPSLPSGIDELILDLITLSYQDLNNLWGIMGSKYLPSVLYKMRLITIEEDVPAVEGAFIKSITIND